MSKKVFATLGMVFGLVIALCGILTITGEMGGNTSYPSSAPYSYESGYASFGADFYTYVSNNSAEAASAARTTASNLEDIADLLKNVCGVFLMGFGMLGFCFFGAMRSDCKADAEKTVSSDAMAPVFYNTPKEDAVPADEPVFDEHGDL